MRRVVSVWLPTWPTDRLRRGSDVPSPEVPVVTVCHDGRRRAIASSNAAARALGLHAGLALAHARARVPGLAAVAADPAEDGAALERLAAWALRYTPLTAPDPPDGLWLDVSGCAPLHGGEPALLADLLGRLKRSGVAARGAVADTPGAAWAAARHAVSPATIIPPGEQAASIEALPVSALRLSEEDAAGLRRLGIELVGQLAAVPRAPLARRFGPHVMRRLDQALGRAAEPISPVFPPETIQHRLAFVEPLLTAEAFAPAIDCLVKAVCGALERAGQGARSLCLLFERVDAQVQAVRIGTARPSRDARHLGRLLAERLEAVDPGLGVEAMRLLVTSADASPWSQRGAEPPADVSALVDRLANRLGAHRVFRAAPVESDVPERAVRAVPALASEEGPSWPVTLPRPVRLFRPPQPVQAIAELPDRPPAAFVWRRMRRRVRRSDGPERIMGEWWLQDGETRASRDYWAVEDEEGRRYWLFRRGDGTDPRTGDLSWFLHGLF